MRKLVSITLIFTILLLLSGCQSREYAFPNKDQPIEKIELLYNPYAHKGNIGGPMETICILEDEDAVAFLDALCRMETKRSISPPPTGYGNYVAQVLYQNGDIEMFGSWHIEFVPKGTSPTRIGSYRIVDDAFEELFCEYAGITSFQEDKDSRNNSQSTAQ